MKQGISHKCKKKTTLDIKELLGKLTLKMVKCEKN
jgi:hypothetical protein